MIDQGQLAGVEVISGCLASLGERGQRNGLIVLSEAANKFHFPYVSDKSIIESNLPEKKKIELLVAQWSKWWNENKTEYSRRPQ